MLNCYECGLEAKVIDSGFVCECGSRSIVESKNGYNKRDDIISCSCEVSDISLSRKQIWLDGCMDIYVCRGCGNIIATVSYKGNIDND